ncbi:MAG: POTRA domain-containing protein, partial [Rhodothermales bacterium]
MESDRFVVRRIDFEGNASVSSETLRQLIRTRTNRTLFGIHGLTPWYFIHRVTGRFGEAPVYLDREVAFNDIERIRLFYESVGYFDASVDTSVTMIRSKLARLTFTINEGPQSRIRNVSYRGLPQTIAAEQRSRFFRQGLSLRRGDPEREALADIPYSLQSLRNEQDRIVDFLKNHGYASAQRDSVRLLLRPDPSDPTLLDARFDIHPGPDYVFGEITMVLDSPPQVRSGVYDTVSIDMKSVERGESSATGSMMRSPTMRFIRETTAETRSGVLSDAMNFIPGQLYSQTDLQNSINELQNLGMLSVTRF